MKRDSDTKQRILALLRAPKYRPLDKKELARALGFKSETGNDLKGALHELEQAGEIARIRKNRYILPAEADLATGKIQIHQAGFGFLSREGSDQVSLVRVHECSRSSESDPVRLVRHPVPRHPRDVTFA